MNRRLPLIFVAASWGVVAAKEPSSAIRFATKDGEWLSGSLEAVAGDRVIWNAPILKQPTAFWIKSIMELTLPLVIPEQKVSHEASLHLTNGDVVRGQLCSVTDDAIVLDTWYGERLHFRRVMIKEVDVLDQSSLIFSGPTGLDGWVQTAKTPSWSYENGELHTKSTRGIGRDVGLPDECCVAFEMQGSESMSLSVNLFVDDLTKDSPKGCYQLNCQGGYVSFGQVGENQGMGGMDGRSVPEFREQGKVRVEVRASQTSGNVSLYVNGRHAANWRAQKGKGKFGKGIQFVPQNPIGSTRLSKIKVTVWDGEVEGLEDENAGLGLGGRFGMIRPNRKPAPKPESKTPEEGRMKLRNGDSIGGEVVSIVDSVITVKTPFAEVKLPVGMVRNITLKPASLEEPIRRNGDVRAWFPDGSSLVFRLDATTADSLTGSSQTFGTATFKLAAFNRIEFNIHEPEINDLRAKDPS